VSFTEIFGGQTLYPAELTYLALDLAAASVELQWPVEQAMAGVDVVADIMDIESSVVGRTITMPDARNVGNGQAVAFNNVGAEDIEILDNTGGTIVTLASGEMWFVYLRSNATQAGTWGIIQYGAGTSTANAAALAGAGLKAITTTLNVQITPEATASTPA